MVFYPTTLAVDLGSAPPPASVVGFGSTASSAIVVDASLSDAFESLVIVINSEEAIDPDGDGGRLGRGTRWLEFRRWISADAALS